MPILGGTSTLTVGSRTTTSITTSSLAAGGVATGTFAISGTAYRIVALQTSAACRLRLYTSVAARTSDASRAVGTDPSAGAGVMLDYVTTDSTKQVLSPLVDGFNDESSPLAVIPYSLTAVASGVITVTLTYLRTE